jgi:hypothetical protein
LDDECLEWGFFIVLGTAEGFAFALRFWELDGFGKAKAEVLGIGAFGALALALAFASSGVTRLLGWSLLGIRDEVVTDTLGVVLSSLISAPLDVFRSWRSVDGYA